MDASEVRRNFRNGDERMPKWDASLKKELPALTEETPCLVALNPQQRQAIERKAKNEGKITQRAPSKMVFAIKTGGWFRSRLVACGNHCAEVLGRVSTSELEGAFATFYAELGGRTTIPRTQGPYNQEN